MTVVKYCTISHVWWEVACRCTDQNDTVIYILFYTLNRENLKFPEVTIFGKNPLFLTKRLWIKPLFSVIFLSKK